MNGAHSNDPEYDDLQKTLACVREITRDFNDMASRLRMDTAGLSMMSEELQRMGDNKSLTPHPALAGPIQEVERSMARRRALGKQLINTADAFAQKLIQWAEALETHEQQKAALSAVPSIPIVTAGNGRMPDTFGVPGHSPNNGCLTDAERNLLRQKNAEAAAIIARFGDKGEIPETPESLLNGPLKTVWGANAGWIPGTTKWDFRQKYKGFSDEDIALMESTRRNGVRALAALAEAGKLPKSQVTRLQLHGMGVLADATLNLAVVLIPYESIAGLASASLLDTTEVAVGVGAREFASQPEQAAEDSIPTVTFYAENEGSISLYVASLPTRPAVGSGAPQGFQIANAGPNEYLVRSGGVQLWADGIDGTIVIETKFVGSPTSSPFVLGSSIPDPIRSQILAGVENQFLRMRKLIIDPTNPLSMVRVITNDPAANPYFRSLLDKYGLNGEIVNP